MTGERSYRYPLQWIPTADVVIGDRLAYLLSNAEAYPTVTGWTDRLLTLSRHGLTDVTHRTFVVRGEPWWGHGDNVYDLDGKALIVKREIEA